MATVCTALARNVSVRTLDISGCRLGEKSGTALQTMLTETTTLKALNLAWSGLSGRAADCVMQGLQGNDTLTHLDMSFNSLGAGGHVGVGVASKLGAFLAANTSLVHLDLQSNSFNRAACEVLAAHLHQNQHIVGLHFSEDNSSHWAVDSKGFVQAESFSSSRMGNRRNKPPLRVNSRPSSAAATRRPPASTPQQAQQQHQQQQQQQQQQAIQKGLLHPSRPPSQIRTIASARMSTHDADGKKRPASASASAVRHSLSTSATPATSATSASSTSSPSSGLAQAQLRARRAKSSHSSAAPGSVVASSDAPVDRGICWICAGWRKRRFTLSPTNPEQEHLLAQLAELSQLAREDPAQAAYFDEGEEGGKGGNGGGSGGGKESGGGGEKAKGARAAFIHFSFDDFRADEMDSDDSGGWVISRMCPPGKLRYAFSLDAPLQEAQLERLRWKALNNAWSRSMSDGAWEDADVQVHDDDDDDDDDDDYGGNGGNGGDGGGGGRRVRASLPPVGTFHVKGGDQETAMECNEARPRQRPWHVPRKVVRKEEEEEPAAPVPEAEKKWSLGRSIFKGGRSCSVCCGV